MEKDKIGALISEALKEETSSLKMSPVLRKSILYRVRNKKPGVYEEFKKLMNTTIEISIPSVIAASLIVCVFTFSAFNITGGMKKDKSIMGYTSIKTINVGGADIIIDSENEVGNYEKDKN